jgi:asparagine synthase (glutamine-hydrolysing)
MCGISGIIDFNKKTSIDDLKSMTDILMHRGPDFGAYEFSNNFDYSIGFGHRRLSIIDLTTSANQPFFSENKDLWLTYNGEIYNYKEIKEELVSLGHKFNTNSDTEVLLKSYVEWGVKCVDRFIGMFAFAIYDKLKQKVYLFRDRAGVKPLNIYYKNGLFLFSSEIKSFHKHKNFKKEIDLNSLALFFRHGYIDSPYSIFKDVEKVLPGHYYEICLKSQSKKSYSYWDVIDYYNIPKLKIDYKDAKLELKNLLKSAFNYRMVSDVSVGVFLSSGYDSSTTAAILANTNSNKINTYTIGFNNTSFDESNDAENIAKHIGTNHTTLHIKENHVESIVENLPFYYDEPFGDSSAIPSILVSKLAKKHVKVVLSSDGGDELFAGYPKHYQHYRLYKTISRTPNFIKNSLSFLESFERFKHRKGLFSSKNLNDLLKVRLETIVFNEDEISKMFVSNFKLLETCFDDFNKLDSSNDFINKLLAIDYKTYLENDILVKVDRATMSQSIEGREPFLDHRLLEFCASLDSGLKFNNGMSKYILKDINRDYIPEGIMQSKKMGFGGPVDKWLKIFLKNELNELLISNEFPEHILNKNYLNEFVKDYNLGRHNKWYRVYQIYSFLKWFKYWM